MNPNPEIPENWSEFSPDKRAEYFSRVGDSNTLASMIHRGLKLPEDRQRKLLSEALTKAAEKVERHKSQGVYSEQAWQDENIAEAYEFAPQKYRAQALDILFNPDGLSLKEHIEKYWPNFKKKDD